MRQARWLDHIPPWLSALALGGSGLFSPGEMAIMALPLLLAAGVEWRRWNLARWQRPLEVGALVVALLLVAAGLGLLPLLVALVFLLSGIRLALPRALPQRRQILLMGFLLFLVAAMSLPSMDFALWALLWTSTAALCLAHQAWVGPDSRPLRRHLWVWTPGVLLLAAGCFLVLPRISAGNRFPTWGVRGIGSGAGLADALDLEKRGPIRSQGGVALRVVPRSTLSPAERIHAAQRLALLKGFSLEALEGLRWEVHPSTPRRRELQFATPSGPEPSLGAFEFQIAPDSTGRIPLPYGPLTLQTPRLWLLAHQPGGGLGWQVPPRNTSSLDVLPAGEQTAPERLTPGRRSLLTQSGEGAECAHRWSLRAAPGELPPARLAERLSEELRGYTYTLANPSGFAPNPLEDFLERTRAGHCEYFASALALALRSRQVPARIAVGYRLGPWVPEGGYWLSTQAEAHSWVEYYDTEAGLWRIADPTPASPAPGSGGLLTRLRRLQDVLTFRWDRYVLRYSGSDQLAGLAWLRRKVEGLGNSGIGWKRPLMGLLLIGVLALGTWHLLRRRSRGRKPRGLRELAPLFRSTRHACPPLVGETARAWLERLAALVPEQREELSTLARMADAAAYGQGPTAALNQAVRVASRNLRCKLGRSMGRRGVR